MMLETLASERSQPRFDHRLIRKLGEARVVDGEEGSLGRGHQLQRPFRLSKGILRGIGDVALDEEADRTERDDRCQQSSGDRDHGDVVAAQPHSVGRNPVKGGRSPEETQKNADAQDQEP